MNYPDYTPTRHNCTDGTYTSDNWIYDNIEKIVTSKIPEGEMIRQLTIESFEYARKVLAVLYTRTNDIDMKELRKQQYCALDCGLKNTIIAMKSKPNNNVF